MAGFVEGIHIKTSLLQTMEVFGSSWQLCDPAKGASTNLGLRIGCGLSFWMFACEPGSNCIYIIVLVNIAKH